MRTLRRDQDGFTLIELLVVILIVGMLAALAIPTFFGQREKAADSAAKIDVRNAVSQMESCSADAHGPEAAAVTACGASTLVLGSGDSAVTFTDGAGGGFALTAASDSGGTFTITKAASSALQRTCAGDTKGCDGGTW